MSPPIVVADIGGTHSRFGLYRGGEVSRVQTFPTTDGDRLGRQVDRFTAGMDGGFAAVSAAIAGPVHGPVARLTNVDWAADVRTQRRPTALFNDLEAAAWGVPDTHPQCKRVLVPAQGDDASPIVVVGVGTGLGVAVRAGDVVLAGEAGHGLFSPVTQLHHGLQAWVSQSLEGRAVEWEDLLSGPGLARLLRFAATHTQPGDEIQACVSSGSSAAQAMAVSAGGDDPAVLLARRLFAELCGVFLRNQALQVNATGGVWLCGGVAGRMGDVLSGTAFRQGFQGVGRMGALMARVPVFLNIDPHLGLRGAGVAWTRLHRG